MHHFKSKIDFWLVLVLYGSALLCLFACFYLIYSQPTSSSFLVAFFILSIGAGLPIWIIKSTEYIVGNSELTIKSGPFTWGIILNEITNIEESRSMISSPALSLDRLKITYSGGRSMLISPIDKHSFMKTIEAHKA